jgi:hypothetical protein
MYFSQDAFVINWAGCCSNGVSARDEPRGGTAAGRDRHHPEPSAPASFFNTMDLTNA